MGDDSQPSGLPHVLWVHTEPLSSALDSATWLETTRELRKLGWHITLVGEGPAGKSCIQGVEVHSLSKPQIYFLGVCAFHLKLLFFLFQQWTTIDAILFHQISALWLLPLRFVRRLKGRRRPLLVMDTRDLVAVEGTLRSRIRRQYFRLMHWLANRWADGQTAITPRMAELVGIPSGQLWGIWPSGVNLDLFVSAQTGRQWPQPEGPVHLIYVGKLDFERNLLPLCLAVERANTNGMAYVLSLVGDGPARRDLEGFASQTTGRIRVRPPVPHPQVPEWLGWAHVGVTSLPPSEDEKFAASSPIKLFEYMAGGLPILATKNACHAEVVADGTYAFWLEDASQDGILAALREVWQTRVALSEKGGEAAAAVRAWTWQEAGRKLSQALKYGLSDQVSINA